MIHFKNHKRGFTLLEVMAAMIVAALILGPIFNLFSGTMNRIRNASRKLDRIVMGKTFLYETHLAQKKTKSNETGIEKKIDDPESTMRYEIMPVSERSSLAGIEGLQREEILISWSDVHGDHTDTLVAFVYKRPKSKPVKS